jgi:hypothetical protein
MGARLIICWRAAPTFSAVRESVELGAALLRPPRPRMHVRYTVVMVPLNPPGKNPPLRVPGARFA